MWDSFRSMTLRKIKMKQLRIDNSDDVHEGCTKYPQSADVSWNPFSKLEDTLFVKSFFTERFSPMCMSSITCFRFKKYVFEALLCKNGKSLLNLTIFHKPLRHEFIFHILYRLSHVGHLMSHFKLHAINKNLRAKVLSS